MTTTTLFAAEPTLPESLRLHHATKGKAERLASAFEADWPALSLYVETNEDDSQATGWRVVHTSTEGENEAHTDVVHSDRVPDLADVLDACTEKDLDPAEGFEEAEKASGSVVREVYRQRYREASTTGQSCGDWLAEWLAVETLDGDGKSDTDALTMVFVRNGLDLTAKWAKTIGSKGWQGRYRMNGRQVLEKAVALSGKLYDANGNDVEVDADWLADARAKHAKWIAKETKRREAEQAVAEAAADAPSSEKDDAAE